MTPDDGSHPRDFIAGAWAEPAIELDAWIEDPNTGEPRLRQRATDEAGVGALVVATNRMRYRTRAVLVADRHLDQSWTPNISLPPSERIHTGPFDPGTDHDVLVVGSSDHAVELTARYAVGGNRVVLAATGMDPTTLSPAGESVLRHLERDRQATLLYRSTPKHILLVDGFPMADFGDRRTPDLQFDHVVYAAPRSMFLPADVGVTDAALATVAREANIRGGASASADVDEAAQGYLMVKFAGNLDFSRKSYFQFDLPASGVNLDGPATFRVGLIILSSIAQLVIIFLPEKREIA